MVRFNKKLENRSFGQTKKPVSNRKPAFCTAYGIRTRATSVKGRRPRPLDERGIIWRRQADSNRRTRFCRPLPSHSAMSPHVRPSGIEPETYCLEGNCSIQLSYGRPNSGESIIEHVGATGFEPATLCSQSRCATGLRYAPMFKHLPFWTPERASGLSFH